LDEWVAVARALPRDFADGAGEPTAALNESTANMRNVNAVRIIKECAENPELLQCSLNCPRPQSTSVDSLASDN
jgi:hypothetical protein